MKWTSIRWKKGLFIHTDGESLESSARTHNITTNLAQQHVWDKIQGNDCRSSKSTLEIEVIFVLGV